MKHSIILFFSLLVVTAGAQNYMKQNISLVGHIEPNNDTIEDPQGNRYSGCWGWYQASKNKEYAISGTSNGTYFIDITVPSSPSVCAFVPGKRKATWREMKTYQNYCYIVSDDAQPNKFTIVDMKYLPDSVHIVHYGNTYFERGHTIFIDKDKMYIGATTYSSGSSCMTVWSLATPTVPVLLRRAEQDIPPPVFSYVHDMYVHNDTIYASTGWQGLHVMKLENNNTFTHLGSYSGYPNAGYNHSSWRTQNGKYLVFCDEVPGGIPIQFVDVQNPGNIQPINDFKPTVNTTPHNPYIVGNNHVVVSCYKDGLYIYDISNPPQVSLSGYFDTYPQGGLSSGDYGSSPYNGNWGAYPYLPSGIVIANDMRNGVFLLNAAAAFSTAVVNPVGLNSHSSEPALITYPNPASDFLSLHYNTTGHTEMRLTGVSGQVVWQMEQTGEVSRLIDVRDVPAGAYVLHVEAGEKTLHKKVIIRH